VKTGTPHSLPPLRFTSGTRGPGRNWQPWAALLLLVVMFAQLLSAATQLSATIDEGFHITSGYEYLRTGRMRLFDEHTPLVKALFAWPLFFVPDLPPLEEAPGWDEGDLIQVAQNTLLAYQPIDRVIVAPRVAVALLTLVLGAAVYRWASRWFCSTAGVLALALMTFDPNILAHGSLATTDMGAVALVFGAVWAFGRYLRHPHKRHWWTAALLLGLAQGAKLTALLLLPVLGVVMLVDVWTQTGTDRVQSVLRRLVSYSGMLVVAAIVVWALYLFEIRTLSNIAGGTIPIPAASHIERWLRLQDNLAYGREAFLLGQNRMHGWWQYFPVAFAVKTPIPTLLFAMLTLGILLLGRRRRLTDELILGLFPLVYGAASLTSTLNIGYRHLLPTLPFLFVSAGRVVSDRWSAAGDRWRIVMRYALCVVLIFWSGVEMLAIHPHYLAYFNLVAGGADQGYRFLADSNTDWGQTLKALAAYQRNTVPGTATLRLSQFTFLDPAVYGVTYKPLAPMRAAPPVLPRRFNPEPGLYAISATTLDGVPLPVPSMYDWFRHRTPLKKVAHAMFVYEVAENRADWVAQCTRPVAPLTPEVVTAGFGSDTLRQIYFDCEQSWILPGGGSSLGWYVRATPGIDGLRWPTDSERLEWWPSWLGQLPLAALHLSYVQPTPGELPAFAIWEWTGAPITPPVAPPQVTLDETLAFLGYAVPDATRPGTTLDVLTYWRVLAQPVRPLSLMLHLVGVDSVPMAVGDGLGVPIDQWRAGDVLVQRHRLLIPEGTLPGNYQLQTGAYWLDTMERWTGTRGTGDEALFLRLEIEP
jgi:hypothetical protein